MLNTLKGIAQELKADVRISYSPSTTFGSGELIEKTVTCADNSKTHRLILIEVQSERQAVVVLAHELGHIVYKSAQACGRLLLDKKKNIREILAHEILASTWALKTLCTYQYPYLRFAIGYLAKCLNTYELDNPYGWKKPLGTKSKRAGSEWLKIAYNGGGYEFT